jgi:hypothetical protein
MGQLAGTTFGIGTPGTYVPSPFSPYGNQGFGISSIAQQPYLQSLSGQGIGGYGGVAPQVQQAFQLLQFIPQQLHHIQILQQQQLAYLQQLLHIVPAQLQQLQQVVQLIPQLSSPGGFGLVPQPFVGQAGGQVM